jgi:hypothetical protein
VIAVACEQRSQAWRNARCGHLTASRAHDMLARGRGRTRQQYLRQLVCEQLSGIPEDQVFVSSAMRHGRLKEEPARAAYHARTGLVVETSGFFAHDTLRAGCSLDGHVGNVDGILEIKAPNTATHLLYLSTRRVPRRYLLQIAHALWITDARWCDFVSFDDRLPDRFQLLIVRVWRDQVDIPGYTREAERFLAEVDAYVTPLATLRPVAFFQAAPLDVATRVLAQCVHAVDARRRERAA